MGLFGKIEEEPSIRVICVKHETREVKEVTKDHESFFGAGSKYNTSTKEYKHEITIVLLAKDGELTYREFNGHWDLSDVKKWEDI